MCRNKYLTTRLEERLTTYVGTYDEDTDAFSHPEGGSEGGGNGGDEEIVEKCLELAGEISKLGEEEKDGWSEGRLEQSGS